MRIRYLELILKKSVIWFSLTLNYYFILLDNICKLNKIVECHILPVKTVKKGNILSATLTT